MIFVPMRLPSFACHMIITENGKISRELEQPRWALKFRTNIGDWW